MYPVMLNIQGQRCLVVGGGGVALGKVQGLLDEGALVRVLAPAPLETLRGLSLNGKIELQQRSYQSGDAAGFSLIFAVTDDKEVNRLVSAEAKQAGIWVNVADDPELCSFHLPARVRRGSFQIAIGSSGGAPFVVRRLRQLLERRFGPEWAEWTEAAARYRQRVRSLNLAPAEKERCFDRFFSSTIDAARLIARVPTLSEQQQWLAKGKSSLDSPLLPVVIPDQQSTGAELPRSCSGFVSLVGAGPGDPGLVTVRGKKRLLTADAIVYDRLAATALPCDLSEQVELHCVGKEAGHHPMPQEEIQALLIRLAHQGKRVVRLKGGDPFVFGRGSEEAQALSAAGIVFEIIPGITAAVAVPAYAGIPVTHRNQAVQVTLVTTHESAKEFGPQVRLDLLAKDPHATLIGYMGVTSLPHVCANLMTHGMDAQTPAAIIERGTTSAQRTIRSTVQDLARAALAANIKPPALFVIGPTIHQADGLEWFTRRPLFGQRLGLFAVADTTSLAETLEFNGAEVVAVPLPLTAVARIVLNALPLTGWIFRNADEVGALEEERDLPGFGPQIVAWCLQPDAAERASQQGWNRVERIQGEDLCHWLPIS